MPPTKANKDKSVRFAESAEVARSTTKRKQPPAPSLSNKNNHGKRSEDNGAPTSLPRKKRPRMDRPNEDELDDVDEWVGDEEEEADDDAPLPSEKEQLEAKRARRQKREVGGQIDNEDNDEEDGYGESTHIDKTTSLEAEGVTIEPFHMDNEKHDGSGYWDGDTFVFRKRAADEEPDAWLESLGDDTKATSAMEASEGSNTDAEEEAAGGKFDHLSKEELYVRILPLVSDTETVMQALVRYGSLLKRKPMKKHRKKHNRKAEENNNDKEGEEIDSMQAESLQMAQNALNELTETANALLEKGDVDVYQKTRNDVLKLLPNSSKHQGASEATAAATTSNNNNIPATTEPSDTGVSWEYKGTQDGEIHGPYSTEQMKAWIQAGYFKGAQVRTVQKNKKSTVDDMLDDLMDDDDDAEGKESKADDELERGEWEISDNVNFDAYL